MPVSKKTISPEQSFNLFVATTKSVLATPKEKWRDEDMSNYHIGERIADSFDGTISLAGGGGFLLIAAADAVRSYVMKYNEFVDLVLETIRDFFKDRPNTLKAAVAFIEEKFQPEIWEGVQSPKYV